MLYLKKFNEIDKELLYAFFQKLPSENGFENKYLHMDKKVFMSEAFIERANSSAGINLLEGHVPDTYFFLFDESQIVGIFKLRHRLNEFLRKGSGHIGYAILPEFRKMGYASKGLSLAIREIVKLVPEYEREIYLSCNLDNIASLKVQKKNGAYIHHSDDKHYYTRIKI